MNKIILPIIKKAMPIMLTAQDIVGVKPFFKIPRFHVQKHHKEQIPDDFIVIDMWWPCSDIREWLETQDHSKWRESKINHGLSVYLRYAISKDLYTLLTLKFS